MRSADVSTLFLGDPLRYEDGIPVFSEPDAYVANYQRIAADHIASMQPGRDNPFIGNDLWEQMECSTRDLITRHFPAGSRVLDVGVGLGRVLGPFAEYERHGIDISFEYLTRARTMGFDVAFSRVEDMPYKEGVFDGVVACDVLEHVFDLNTCCRQILRVLRPGGVLIVRVPYREDLTAYLDPALPYEFVHLRNFDIPSLRLLFTKVFPCEYVEHAGVAPYLQGIARVKLRPLPSNNAARLIALEASGDDHPLALLKKATLVTEEELLVWLYNLQNEHAELFQQLAEHLLHPMDMNMVFRKRL